MPSERRSLPPTPRIVCIPSAFGIITTRAATGARVEGRLKTLQICSNPAALQASPTLSEAPVFRVARARACVHACVRARGARGKGWVGWAGGCVWVGVDGCVCVCALLGKWLCGGVVTSCLFMLGPVLYEQIAPPLPPDQLLFKTEQQKGCNDGGDPGFFDRV